MSSNIPVVKVDNNYRTMLCEYPEKQGSSFSLYVATSAYIRFGDLDLPDFVKYKLAVIGATKAYHDDILGVFEEANGWRLPPTLFNAVNSYCLVISIEQMIELRKGAVQYIEQAYTSEQLEHIKAKSLHQAQMQAQQSQLNAMQNKYQQQAYQNQMLGSGSGATLGGNYGTSITNAYISNTPPSNYGIQIASNSAASSTWLDNIVRIIGF